MVEISATMGDGVDLFQAVTFLYDIKPTPLWRTFGDRCLINVIS